MSREKDYTDDFNIFGDYNNPNEFYDEEDEEIGIDYHSNPEPSSESSNEEHTHLMSRALPAKIKPLPASFRKMGVVEAHLLMKNGKVIILK